MRNFFSNDTPLGRIACLVADFVILNILWVLCSLPIITMGSATTALYCAIGARSRGEEQMTRTFFRGFKRNFFQSFIAWLISLAIGLLLFFSVYIIAQWDNHRTMGLMILCLPIMLYAIIVSYLFPLLAEFETSIPRLFMNAVLLSLAHFPRSMVIALINVLPIIIFFLFPAELVCLVFVWLPVGFSLCAHFNYRLLSPVFSPFRPEETDIPDDTVW